MNQRLVQQSTSSLPPAKTNKSGFYLMVAGDPWVSEPFTIHEFKSLRALLDYMNDESNGIERWRCEAYYGERLNLRFNVPDMSLEDEEENDES